MVSKLSIVYNLYRVSELSIVCKLSRVSKLSCLKSLLFLRDEDKEKRLSEEEKAREEEAELILNFR